MQSNIRPETMERITTLALANAFIDEQIAEIRAQVGDKKVLLALSGGVDSSVVAALLIKAIGKQLVCVHVNHGLMRKDESEGVIKMFKDGMDANLIYVDATDHFLDLLAGVSDPESKRKIIGKEFITVFAEEARKQVGDKKVLLALSGGVDSSVVAALLIKAIGKQLVCVHVNHGLMRKDESEGVIKMFKDGLDANLIYVDATDHFLNLLAGVSDPETKRKIIGKEFITVFADEARKLEGISFLAQGTIYPDILESIKAAEGKKAVKSHHNVGGLPEDLQFELVEPIKLLFKDEVRVVGEALGLPHAMVYRQPFPGPGLGVRCLGAITRDRLHALREADAILREEFDKNGLAEKVWQYFIAVPDIKSVGVRDESRYEGWPAIIRAVNTKDAMSATIEEIPYEILHKITYRITHEVEGINRVLLDLTPKPIGTIEWE